MKHAKLSASGSTRWLNCPGSILETEKLKSANNESSPFALEGTLAHELSDLCFKNNCDASDYVGKEIDAGNGPEMITKEMAYEVQKYIDYVLSFTGDTRDDEYILLKEETVSFSNIVPDGFGTMDNGIIFFKSKTAHIFDLKYGKGVKVFAENNTQAMFYCSGLYQEYSSIFEIDKFVIHIGQPRLHHFDSWEISKKDLLKWQKEVKVIAKQALKPNAPIVPGEKQCRFCPVSSNCKALMNYTHEVISAEFDDVSELSSNSLTLDDLRKILDAKGLIEKFLKDVHNRVRTMLLDGDNVPGYKLVEGRSNRKWKDDAESVLAEKLGDDAYKKTLIGIGVASKMIDKETLDKLLYKPPGPSVLAKDDDPRSEITSDNNFEDQS